MKENKADGSATKKEHSPVSTPPETVEHQHRTVKNQNQTDEKHNKSSLFRTVKNIGGILFFAINIVTFLILWGQFNVSKSQLIYSQRAWVTAEDVSLSKLKVGEPTTAEVKFVNSGSSPALQVVALSGLAITSTPISVPNRVSQNDNVESRGVLAPKTFFFSELKSGEHTTQTIQAINAEKIKMYVWGIVEYDDIFGVRHGTKFCFVNYRGGITLAACDNNNDIYDVSK